MFQRREEDAKSIVAKKVRQSAKFAVIIRAAACSWSVAPTQYPATGAFRSGHACRVLWTSLKMVARNLHRAHNSSMTVPGGSRADGPGSGTGVQYDDTLLVVS